MKIALVRGLPGSGKSTFAKSLIGYTHFEADMFFDTSLGYKFQGEFLGVAHDWCFVEVVKALREGKNVVVSNTFTKHWEMERFLGLGLKMFPGLEYEIYEMTQNYGNIHGVPPEKLEQMKNRWEELPESCKVIKI